MDMTNESHKGSHTFIDCADFQYSLVEDFKIAVSQDRVDGTRLILAQALVGDETASIQIRVQENNIGLLQIASDSKGR
jgi:hypothetical protein